jgi:hypothetical protein
LLRFHRGRSLCRHVYVYEASVFLFFLMLLKNIPDLADSTVYSATGTNLVLHFFSFSCPLLRCVCNHTLTLRIVRDGRRLVVIFSYIWFTLYYGRVPLSQCVAYFSTLLLLSIGCLIGYFRPNAEIERKKRRTRMLWHVESYKNWRFNMN